MNLNAHFQLCFDRMKNKKYLLLQFSSSSPSHHLLFYVLFAANLVSLLYFVMLGYYNRLALDDYCYLAAQNEHGFLSPFNFWYQNYQGRFSAQFFINFINNVYGVVHSLLPFTLLFLVLFIGIIHQLFKKLAPALSLFETLNLSIFFFSVFVINNYEFNTFYWLNASAMYFGGVLFLLIGLNVILSRRINFWTHFWLILSAIYAGSSSETFALIWCGVAGLIILFYLRKLKFNGRSFIANLHLKKLLIAFSLCIISFIIMYLAPGNGVRLKITAWNIHQQVPLSFGRMIPAAMHAFLVFGGITCTKLFYWIFLALPFVYMGNSLKDKVRMNQQKTINIIIASVGFIIFLWMCLLPTVYVQGEIGPKRALTHVAFYITCFVVFLSLSTGLKIPFESRKLIWPGIISVILWAVIVSGRLYQDIPEAKKYARSEDVRIAYLKKFENKFVQDTLLLHPLHIPVSLMQGNIYHPLQPNEIKPVHQDFVNDCICRGLHLEFHVKLKADTIDTNQKQ